MNHKISSSGWESSGRNSTLPGFAWMEFLRLTEKPNSYVVGIHLNTGKEKDCIGVNCTGICCLRRQYDGTDIACMTGAKWGWGGGEKNTPPFPTDPPPLSTPATQARTDV